MLPQLPREPIRPELEFEDKEIWKPEWRCFCCQDFGTVSPILVRLVIPDYDHHRDKIVACQHPNCEAGTRLQCDFNYDQRFTARICIELDEIAREDWRNTIIAQQKRFVDLNCVKNLRSRPRTSESEMMAYQNHQAVLAEVNSGLGSQGGTGRCLNMTLT